MRTHRRSRWTWALLCSWAALVLLAGASAGIAASAPRLELAQFTTAAHNTGAAAAALQPDGKIIVAGHAGAAFALARYTADGGLDSSFDGGIVRTEFPLPARAMLPLITLDMR